MDKLTLQISTDADYRGQQLHDFLLKRMDSALHNSSVEYQRYKDYAEITLARSNPQASKSAKSRKEWRESVYAVLADYILDYYEEELLRRMVRKDKCYSTEEGEELLTYCRQLESVSDMVSAGKDEQLHGRVRRRGLLLQDLSACLEQESLLHVDGFLRFRLGKYGTELKDMLEYASDEYMMDQQYKEFISLLRYFVYIQESKIPVAHIMHKNQNEFMLLNDQLKPINTEQLDTTFRVEFLDKDYNLEDLIVSTLITIAPERIVIHTREPELPVIKTISQIFEDRCEVCGYCRICSSTLGEAGSSNKQNKLSP